jgi:predicted lipoprotein with Yx(FWY)xxD motif
VIEGQPRKGVIMIRVRSINLLAGAAAIPLVALAVAGCGGGGDNGGSAAAAPVKTTASQAGTTSGQAGTVGTANVGSLGTILVDSQGRTLYLFQADSGGKSACSGQCAAAWPPLRADGKPTAGSGVNASLLGTIPRPDGKPQVTYNGHPLYTFVDDQGPGQATGQGSTAFGAAWFAVNPAGDQVTSQAASNTSTSGSSGGSGGYAY